MLFKSKHNRQSRFEVIAREMALCERDAREAAQVALAEILCRPPTELGGGRIAASALAEVGRLTSAALTAFAETEFRSARFLVSAEGAVS